MSVTDQSHRPDVEEGQFVRRAAIKAGKVHPVLGHQFMARHFAKPHYCCHCKELMIGLGTSGYTCNICHFSCHKRCHEFVNLACPGSEEAALLSKSTPKKAHSFVLHTYQTPHFCDECGGMLYGVTKQGFKCSDCHVNAHKRCIKNMPKTCGFDHTERRGRLHVDVKFETRQGGATALTVIIYEAKNLLAMDLNGYSDPYVVVQLLPDPQKASEQKTIVHYKTLNPIFKELFEFDFAPTSHALQKRLLITVWDRDAITADDFIGGFSFGVAEIAHQPGGINGWFKLLNRKSSDYMYTRIFEEVVSVKVDAALSSLAGPPSVHTAAAPAGAAGAPPPAAVTAAPAASLAAAVGHLPHLATEYHTAPVAPALTAVAAPLHPHNDPHSHHHPHDRHAHHHAHPIDNASYAGHAMSLDDFIFLKVLGRGSFGKVLLSEHKVSGNKYAIKSLKKDAVVLGHDLPSVLTEKKILAMPNRSPFMTTLVASFQSHDRLFFVMELVSGGDLFFNIGQVGRFAEERARFYAAEIALGLFFLHDHGIIYRDLKLDNVMLTGDGHVKIADFGMCHERIVGGATTTTFCGTPDYMAPEIITCTPYDKSVDWWSFGVLLFEMIAGAPPFTGATEDDLYDNIISAPIPRSRHFSPAADAAIRGFLARDAALRLGCRPTGKTDIKSHAFFRDINWEDLAAQKTPPPFVPAAKAAGGANADAEFLTLKPVLTACAPDAARFLDHLEGDEFAGFSYTAESLLSAAH